MESKVDNRNLGEAGELRVLSELLLRGFKPAKYLLDDGIDILLGNSKSIQVKTSNTKLRSNFGTEFYFVNLLTAKFKKGKNVHNKHRLVADFLIVWIVPLNDFFIIPKEVVGGRLGVGFTVNGKYQEYKDKWDLLL